MFMNYLFYNTYLRVVFTYNLFITILLLFLHYLDIFTNNTN